MSKKPEPPETQDAGLFRQVLDGVTPLKPSGRVATAPVPRHAIVRATAVAPAIKDNLSDHGASDELLTEFRRDGISPMMLRRLRRGQFPTQDSLDLHGLSSNEARRLLQEFLAHSARRGLRCVHVIHGKGWQPGGGEGILKIRARHWLTQCAEVLAFCEAPPNAGGGGAVRVLLKNISEHP